MKPQQLRLPLMLNQGFAAQAQPRHCVVSPCHAAATSHTVAMFGIRRGTNERGTEQVRGGEREREREGELRKKKGLKNGDGSLRLCERKRELRLQCELEILSFCCYF